MLGAGDLAQVVADILWYVPANRYGLEVQEAEAELSLHLGISPMLVTGNGDVGDWLLQTLKKF